MYIEDSAGAPLPPRVATSCAASTPLDAILKSEEFPDLYAVTKWFIHKILN